jgi:predicted DNA-binding transcriptional regulator YafY
MRGTQLARQWKIIRLLESRTRGVAVANLSSELYAPARTVYRDLEALQEAGFPLYSYRIDKHSYWKLIEGFKAHLPLPFTTTELMSLHMSRDILRIFDGTVFQESIESLFEKVKTSLPPETIPYIKGISQRVTVGFGPSKDYQAVKEFISQVSEASGKSQCVEIVYKAASTGKETTRKVDPYQVWATNGGFYLIGLCHLRNSVRTFAVERIKRLSVLDESFHRPNDFSLGDYLQTAFRVMRGSPRPLESGLPPDIHPEPLPALQIGLCKRRSKGAAVDKAV